MTLKESLLIGKVQSKILEFSEIDKNDCTTSDYQGLAMVTAMDIIKLVKLEAKS